jgi:ACS family hexuronate transporter-like MFS transporter
MSSTSPSLRWTIAVLLCLSTALNYLDRQVLSILATTIQKDLGIDDIGYAKITTYFLLSYTIMYAVSGRLVDFLGTRLSLAWAVAGWSVAGMLHGAANSVAQLSLCRFILGTFEAANFPAGAKAVSEWFPLKERALGMGLFASGGALGAVIAFPMVTWLALSYGWRSTFVVVGAIGFLWAVAWLAVCKKAAPVTVEQSPNGVTPAPLAEKPFGLKELLGYRRTWGCILVRVFTDPIIYFISFWVPKYLTANHGYTLSDIGLFAWIPFAALSAGQISGGALVNWLVGRGYGLDPVRKHLMLGASLLVLVSGALVALTTSPSLALAGVAFLALGHGLFGNLAVPAEVFPSHSVAFVTGLGGTLGGVVGIISQFCIAWAAGHQGYPYIFAVFSVFPLLAFFSVKLFVGQLGVISHRLPQKTTIS